jgi:hypothetical protein
MSTNYYATMRTYPSKKRVHLGLTAAGWKFLAYAKPTWERESALRLWIDQIFNCSEIVDEYEHFVPKPEFLAMVFRKNTEEIDWTEYIESMGISTNLPYWTCDNVNFCSDEFS